MGQLEFSRDPSTGLVVPADMVLERDGRKYAADADGKARIAVFPSERANRPKAKGGRVLKGLAGVDWRRH